MRKGFGMKKKALGWLIVFLLYAAITFYMVLSSGWMIAAKAWGITFCVGAVAFIAAHLMTSDE